MLTLIKNAQLYSPAFMGKKDLLIAASKIVAIADNLDGLATHCKVIDAKEKIVTPGLIDQHIHITGAGGKSGFSSKTPEISLSELIACGTTTVMGLSGTDGTSRNIRDLYGKVKSLEEEGISAFMLSGYYGLDSITMMGDLQSDMMFIDKVIGCKIAICDIRSSYPTALDLVRKAREVMVGGFVGNKKGILHVHLGNLNTKMDLLFEMVTEYQFPIKHISPTHVGRTKELFDQAMDFAKLGGMIDITTGASKYTDPYKMVLYALENGVSMDKMTFSTDGNAGLTKFDEAGNAIGIRKAPIDKNLEEVVNLIQKGGVSIQEAFKLITINPAINLGLGHKGRIELGCDADLCFFNENLELTDVFALGQHMMKDGTVIVKGKFDS